MKVSIRYSITGASGAEHKRITKKAFSVINYDPPRCGRFRGNVSAYELSLILYTLWQEIQNFPPEVRLDGFWMCADADDSADPNLIYD